MKPLFRKLLSVSVFWRICCLALLTSSCKFSPSDDPMKITHINIIDRNGLSETITSKDRLSPFQKTDFLAPQPYQKVMRVYGRDEAGDVQSCITSYHPNGLVKQYLEAINNRAKGAYKEWHMNGQLKVEATVIGGSADINTLAEESFLFDGISKAWDEEGNLMAEIPYDKGVLQGTSRYFHKNGNTWKLITYRDGMVDGNMDIYLENNTLFSRTSYVKGVKEGISFRYWEAPKLAYDEHYKEDLLLEAKYYDTNNNLISKVENGQGKKAVFGQKHLKKLIEYKDGRPEGIVEIYDEKGNLTRVYSCKNGEKEGEERAFFSSKQPRLSLNWKEGILQGAVKTWYENGKAESQKEMSQNKKHGLSTAWYPDGELMLVEEYEEDNLIKGKYFNKGEKIPISTIEKGSGIATIFDVDGNLLRKIPYHDGRPDQHHS